MGVNGVSQNIPRAYQAQSRAAGPAEQGGAKAEQAQIRADAIAFSGDAHARRAEELKAAQAEADSFLKQMERQLESAQRQGDAMAEDFDTQRKCLTIASRIMNGDKVPGKDASYLLKHNPGLYLKAVMMRRQKEKPQEHKSVLGDEKKDTAGNAGAGGRADVNLGGAAQVVAAATAAPESPDSGGAAEQAAE